MAKAFHHLWGLQFTRSVLVFVCCKLKPEQNHELKVISTPELLYIRGKCTDFIQMIWRAFTGPHSVLKPGGKARGSFYSFTFCFKLQAEPLSYFLALAWRGSCLGCQSGGAFSRPVEPRSQQPGCGQESWVPANLSCRVPAGWEWHRPRPSAPRSRERVCTSLGTWCFTPALAQKEGDVCIVQD